MSEEPIIVNNQEGPTLKELTDNPELLEEESEKIVQLAEQIHSENQLKGEDGRLIGSIDINDIKEFGTYVVYDNNDKFINIDKKTEQKVKTKFIIKMHIYQKLFMKNHISLRLYLSMLKNLINESEIELTKPYVKEEVIIKEK